MSNDTQLRLIGEVVDVLGDAEVDCWLRGGWALDFHLGDVTREHEDVDLVAWLADGAHIQALLEPLGYVHAPLPNDRPELGLRLRKEDEEVAFTFVERTEGGALTTRGYEQWPWPAGMLEEPPRTLRGLTCRPLTVDALLDELEMHEEWSGHPLRPKDCASVALLRRFVQERSAR